MLERGAARSHWISLCIERTAEYKLVLRGCLFSDRVELTRQFVRTNFSTDRAPGGTFRAYNYHKRDRMQPSAFSRVCIYVCMYLRRKTFRLAMTTARETLTFDKSAERVNQFDEHFSRKK